MFRKLSNGFRLPSGEVKETSAIINARAAVSVESTIKEILELYVSRKNMSVILEFAPIVGSSSYFLFKEYINKPVRQMPRNVLNQVIADIDANRIPLLKEESPALREKLSSVMDAHLSSILALSAISPK